MRNLGWLIVVGALLISPAAAQEEEAPSAEGMERSAQALELLAREAKIQFEQRRQEIELNAMEARMGFEREEHEAEMAERRAKAERRTKAGRHGKDNGGGALVLAWILVVHILLTIWVCKDMREKKIGRTLWVPIVLLAGICGAVLYAIVRLADTRSPPAEG